MTSATNKTIVAIVLAAGAATRFGATKQLAELGGITLARRAVEAVAASHIDTTVVVVGHDWHAVSAAVQPFDGYLLHNEGFAEGMGTSLSLAVRATRHAADAVIVVLADQPLVTPEHLNALLDAWSGTANEIVATAAAGVTGPPALLAAACFDDLARLEGDQGARTLLTDSRFTVKEIAFADAAIDIDAPADLNRLRHSARS